MNINLKIRRVIALFTVVVSVFNILPQYARAEGDTVSENSVSSDSISNDSVSEDNISKDLASNNSTSKDSTSENTTSQNEANVNKENDTSVSNNETNSVSDNSSVENPSNEKVELAMHYPTNAFEGKESFCATYQEVVKNQAHPEKFEEFVPKEIEGKDFLGWYTKDNVKWNPETDVFVEDTVLYAVFTPITIKFYDNFNNTYKVVKTLTFDEPSKITNEIVNEITLTEYNNDSDKDNYNFIDWYQSDNDYTFQGDEERSYISGKHFVNDGNGSHSVDTVLYGIDYNHYYMSDVNFYALYRRTKVICVFDSNYIDEKVTRECNINEIPSIPEEFDNLNIPDDVNYDKYWTIGDTFNEFNYNFDRTIEECRDFSYTNHKYLPNYSSYGIYDTNKINLNLYINSGDFVRLLIIDENHQNKFSVFKNHTLSDSTDDDLKDFLNNYIVMNEMMKTYKLHYDGMFYKIDIRKMVDDIQNGVSDENDIANYIIEPFDVKNDIISDDMIYREDGEDSEQFAYLYYKTPNNIYNENYLITVPNEISIYDASFNIKYETPLSDETTQNLKQSPSYIEYAEQFGEEEALEKAVQESGIILAGNEVTLTFDINELNFEEQGFKLKMYEDADRTIPLESITFAEACDKTIYLKLEETSSVHRLGSTSEALYFSIDAKY